MLSKKKSEPQGPLFFCSLGYEHTVNSHWDRFCFNLQTKGKKNRTF